MLNPCNPCVCFTATCEQCMFANKTAKQKHEIMKNLINLVNAGENS